ALRTPRSPSFALAATKTPALPAAQTKSAPIARVRPNLTANSEQARNLLRTGFSTSIQHVASAPPPRVRSLSPAAPIALKMDDNIMQAISFRRRGHDIPEGLLPTDHPATEGNKTELLVDGAQVFPSILRDLQNAKDSIHITHYALSHDKLGAEVGEVLMAK